ncbi:response regulator [Nostoc sp. MG11]|uniref:response regulator n=1 Tax=Nostoc sp. MG11 TaxID=2721166 RepID=UPI0018672679|nr:response regulator [Nostoc sp. MG11]
MNLINNSPFKVGILKDVQVLVVDNDLDSGVLYSIFLKYFDANVVTCGSVNEALEILGWFVPNIVICEIRFLGESIYTLINRLNAIQADNKNQIPIIVTSTCATGSLSQIPDVQFEGYLLKPINLDKMVLMISNLVQAGRSISSAYGQGFVQEVTAKSY